MDSTDAAILNELKNNARIANLDLAKKVHLSPSAVLERVRRLRANGIIRGFQSRFDCVKLGLGLTVLIELRIAQNIGADGGIGRKLAAIPEVIEIYDVAGEFDYLLKAVTANSETLGALLARIGRIPGILSSRTTLIISTLKEETAPDFRFPEVKK